MQKILIICGPTATGKTSLAFDCAEKFNGELISADSRQVYKHMDVVTGKDIPKKFEVRSASWRTKFKMNNHYVQYYTDEKTRIWGLDIVEPSEEFSVRHWVEYANIVIDDIWKRGKLPIFVGGTGFYLSQLFNPSQTITVPRNPVLRNELKDKNSEELFGILLSLDPQKAGSLNASDAYNPRRLIRAIEVAKYYEKDQRRKIKDNTIDDYYSSLNLSNNTQLTTHNINIYWIGLTVHDRKELFNRIDKRVEQRVGSRMDNECQYLKDNNLLSYAPSHTIGYQQWIRYMNGLCTKQEAIQMWKYKEHGYARRQMVWFRKRSEIEWYTINDQEYPENVLQKIKTWYTQ